jgi:hypothetical protein
MYISATGASKGSFTGQLNQDFLTIGAAKRFTLRD